MGRVTSGTLASSVRVESPTVVDDLYRQSIEFGSKSNLYLVEAAVMPVIYDVDRHFLDDQIHSEDEVRRPVFPGPKLLHQRRETPQLLNPVYDRQVQFHL